MYLKARLTAKEWESSLISVICAVRMKYRAAEAKPKKKYEGVKYKGDPTSLNEIGVQAYAPLGAKVFRDAFNGRWRLWLGKAPRFRAAGRRARAGAPRPTRPCA